MTGFEQDTALIRALIEYAGVSAAQVAKKAKVDAKTVQRPASGRAEARLSQSTLEKLRDAFPKFPGWTDDVMTMSPPVEAEKDDLVEVAQIDMRYGMGSSDVSGPVELAKRLFPRAWLRSFTDARPEDLVWAAGRGDSMHPTIRDGEPILINLADRTLTADDCVWACAIGDFGMIKRLRPTGEGVTIMSDNPLVSDDFAADEELQVIGRVIAKVGRL